MNELQNDTAVGAMLGTFVGDALGMPWEGAAPTSVPRQPEMVDARLGAGTYTDDTEMMIAVAESLLRCDVVDEEDLAQTFRAICDPRRGYGAGTARVFALWRDGIGIHAAASRIFDGIGSLGNGAAMRVAPLAVRFYDDTVLLSTQVRRSARLTHAHRVGIDGASVQAAAIAAALDGEDPFDAALRAAVTRELRAALADAWRRSRDGLDPTVFGEGRGVAPTADVSVATAVTIATLAESFEEAVTTAVRAGGDTDTTAAMAGAIAGARFGARSIPAPWADALEDGERGRRHVERLASALADRAASSASGTLARGRS